MSGAGTRVAAPVPVGLVLAAGDGTRMGGPKGALRTTDGTPWVVAACAVLRAAGCAEVLVVVGAHGDEVARLVPSDVAVVRASGWERGPQASLAAGVADLVERYPDRRGTPRPDVAVVVLVDAPTTPDVVARVLGAARGPAALARATYAGRPGHPVVLGRDHWPALARGGGARDLLAGPGAVAVPCADLHDGRDADTPADLVGPDAVRWGRYW
ncbi:nucleotidyltransferase family protein [Cellulomonas marina]|uniref:Nicotine blue oxidoreductase n=1 Tax=Cellulomonas marina TaxID=988821 RepID=A0A1I1AGR4_9CELL|nr:NTP transferase domain-containing protein [Cellulomonas marina]GIG29738.1 hypothetical protein Cma02nite_23380 [Cellulomonas marina]SFB35688.1 nicotine blue oxidoreductase [Cellulomonas marina]